MKKKKLYFIGPTLASRNNYGGATIKNENLINYLKDKGIELKVIDTDNWKKNLLKILFNLLKIFFSPNSNKIILSTSSGGTYLFLKLNYYLNIFNKKVIYFVVGGDTPLKLEKQIYQKKYYSKIEKIYIETIKMKDKMKELGLYQTEYLPNFKNFEFKEFKEKKISETMKCLFFSRITPEKGTEIILSSLKKIKTEKISVDFYGPIDQNYQQEFLEKIKLNKNMKYKGILDIKNPESYEKISEYDLMLFPTYWKGEGFAGVIIDSFIAGVPVLASNWNYNEEIVQNLKTGLIFESKNFLDFEKKIEYLLKNRKNLNQMRINCFKEREKFHINNVLKEIKF